ncbi:unnamed protein product [Brachionus calyciflorus]|uniref:Uncharacterized protein n=1 Tax=Brachionus calyciflorus TaxID=104777 RepID=A0A813U4W4_9BILA|nr:unnamed protein product [Brachionus calyciflorus]
MNTEDCYEITLENEEVDQYLFDNCCLIRRWVYNPLDMATSINGSLVKVLLKCDNRPLQKVLTRIGLKATTLPDGEERDYFTMLKRNIEFMRIFINRRVLFGNYHDMDKFHIAHTQEYRLAQMDTYIRENEDFERNILERLFREYAVGLNMPIDNPEDETNEDTDETTSNEE